jgi:hypothetical protein
MSTPGVENYQTLADSLTEHLYSRVAAAKPKEVLSTKHGKLLRVVEAADGELFITRSFAPEAIHEIESHYGLDFMQAWEEMHGAFAEAGIEVVPSTLIEIDGGEYPFIAISEYMKNAKPLSMGTLEAKKKAAAGLAGLLVSDRDYIPSPEMVREDMFVVVEHEGQTKPMLLDVDPLMVQASRIRTNDRDMAFYIRELSEKIWDYWCTEEDRVSVATATIQALGSVVLDDFDMMDSQTGQAFIDLHMLSNDVDHRHMWRD